MLLSTAATLIEGATDFQVIAINGPTSISVSCALATSTASGGVLVGACGDQVAIAGSNTKVFAEPLVTLTPVPVQVPDNYNLTSSGGSVVASATTSGSARPSVTPAAVQKSSGVRSSRMSLGGVAVSVLVVLSTAGLMLTHV